MNQPKRDFDKPTDEEIISAIKSFFSTFVNGNGNVYVFGGFLRKVLVPSIFKLEDKIVHRTAYNWEGDQSILIDYIRHASIPDIDIWVRDFSTLISIIECINRHPDIDIDYDDVNIRGKYPFDVHQFWFIYKNKYICDIDFVVSSGYVANDVDISSLTYGNGIFVAQRPIVGYGSSVFENVDQNKFCVQDLITKILTKKASILPTFNRITQGTFSPPGYVQKSLIKKANQRLEKYKNEEFELDLQETFADNIPDDGILTAIHYVTDDNGNPIYYICKEDSYFRVDPTDHTVFVGSQGIVDSIKDIIIVDK